MPASRRVVTEPTIPGHVRPADVEEDSVLSRVTAEDRAELAPIETAILDQGLSLRQGLLKAAAYKEDASLREHYTVVRGGTKLFGFDLRPLSEDEIDSCAEEATTYIENKKWGPVPIPEKTDKAEYRRRLIAKATPEPDFTRVWGDQAVWDAIGHATHHDAVRILLPGEVDECIALINRISGYQLDARDQKKGREQAKS